VNKIDVPCVGSGGAGLDACQFLFCSRIALRATSFHILPERSVLMAPGGARRLDEASVALVHLLVGPTSNFL
jgi:hypothetical protein